MNTNVVGYHGPDSMRENAERMFKMQSTPKAKRLANGGRATIASSLAAEAGKTVGGYGGRRIGEKIGREVGRLARDEEYGERTGRELGETIGRGIGEAAARSIVPANLAKGGKPCATKMDTRKPKAQKAGIGGLIGSGLGGMAGSKAGQWLGGEVGGLFGNKQLGQDIGGLGGGVAGGLAGDALSTFFAEGGKVDTKKKAASQKMMMPKHKAMNKSPRAQKLAMGGVGKIRHGEATSSGMPRNQSRRKG